MTFVFNLKKTSCTIYDRNSDPIVVPAKCAVSASVLRGRLGLTPVKSFINHMWQRGVDEFYIQRAFAIGDVLMLVPIVRYLRTLNFNPYLRTSRRYTSILGELGVKAEAIEGNGNPSTWGILLDHTVELDHITPKLQKFHRIEIYLNALGINFPKDLDWEIDLADFPDINVEQPYIVFQGKGTTHKKWLPNQSIQFLINKMNGEGIKVVYIGNAIGKTNEKVKIDRKKNIMAFMKYSLSQLFTLIAGAKAVICMDSAPLWISHFTRTPVIAILGPTRPEQRISKHPLYPEGAEAVCCNELINCKPCFEASARCKHKISCLNITPQRIWKELEPKVIKFWRD